LNISSREGLYRNYCGEKPAQVLGQVLKTNKTLMILDISGNSIKSEGLEYMVQGIVMNNTLASLRVAQNEIQGSITIAEVLKTIVVEGNLLEFDVSDNPLGDPCIEALAKSIRAETTTIKRMLLMNIDLTSESSINFFPVIKSIGKLKSLRLDHNDLNKDEARFPLEELVGRYSILVHLSLTNCNLTDELGVFLFRGINNNRKHIRTLMLSKNKLGIQTSIEIKQSLEVAKIEVLDLSYNRINVSIYMII